MQIGIGSDHNGFQLKEQIKDFLEQKGIDVVDYGCYSPESTDYPDVAFEVAKEISSGKIERGVLICGTGIGVAIAAGKYPGIRAALCHDPYSAERAQKSNNAQVLTMGAQIIGLEAAKKVVEAYVNSSFDSNSPSNKKVQKIIDREKELLQTSGIEYESRSSCS
ncbi:ribose 5-phosphate isomerase B [Peribacillus sp. SCS-155]|uniref:ribose 5-phosphate isomerase B n=1 Tax=Peribacillus sedimenti TaxID=3115297 RepID=UPI003905C4BA